MFCYIHSDTPMVLNGAFCPECHSPLLKAINDGATRPPRKN